ncbi:NADPH dehydrogenase NamA [Virgibacillus sp. 179-BFC.A HS]|uniref:NADPH dehydrogenase n=1 Tax=Tigheibacillus jepli TaxID=3035914 RepID=A0ABU5CH40_9BACI|nr:NADPH dehydrogenase NamA [Virgibacillus sp. 179-BFC.A HS]MDY0405639.1 NADPH dehydrogenase NamA [Virgibacillus sp. 179-BFC.A HS]
MSKLFTPITFNNITIKNRIAMSPMCMYSCFNEDGKITPFHMTHYVSRAVGQVGLVMTEATAVLPEGRISPRDLGIWEDEHIDGLKELNEQLHSYGAKTGIQLAHAGRKAELDGDIFAPSAIGFDEKSKTPNEMDIADIERTIDAFKKGASRAKQAGFDIIEIHAAHGYLINEFLSPLANHRSDLYGGSKENRYRFLNEIIQAVKEVWEGPLFVRISTNEYQPEGNRMTDILYFSEQMKMAGVDLIDCSSGGVVHAKINAYPGYQVNRCDQIKHEANIPTGAVGLITTGIQAEEILQNDRADMVVIGRSLLRNPYWAKAAADELHAELTAPVQYERGWK